MWVRPSTMTRGEEEARTRGHLMKILEAASKERKSAMSSVPRISWKMKTVLHRWSLEGARKSQHEDWRCQSGEESRKKMRQRQTGTSKDALQALVSPGHSKRQAGPIEGQRGPMLSAAENRKADSRSVRGLFLIWMQCKGKKFSQWNYAAGTRSLLSQGTISRDILMAI